MTAKTEFGRSIINQTTQGLKVNQSGSFIKTGFGDFELRTALSTQHDAVGTSAIYIEAGKLRLVAEAIEGPTGVVQGVSDIDILASGTLEIVLDTNRTFDRIVSGDGAINLKREQSSEEQRQLILSSSCALKNKGNISIGDGVHLIFGHNLSSWRPGSAAKVSIAPTGGLTLRGNIIPQGGIFNPFFTQGQGVIFAKGQTHIAITPERNSLLIGNNSDTLHILRDGAVILSPDSNKVIEIDYALQSDDNRALLALAGNGKLLLQDSSLEHYRGVLKNDSAEGALYLKNAQVHPALQLHFGASKLAKTVFDIDTGTTIVLGPDNIIKKSSGSVSKVGAGRLVIDSSSGLNSWSGKLDIVQGALELHNVARAARSETYVQKNAHLIAWSDSSIDMKLGRLTLASGANLIITERDFIRRDQAAQNNAKRPVNISELNAHAGSEIIFAVNPDGGLTAGHMSFNTALLKIEAANMGAPLYVRMVPINERPYEVGTLHALIEFDTPELAAAIAPKIKLRPTIRALKKISYEGGVSVANDTPLFADLALGPDASGNFKYLVAQINDIGFAPGLPPAKKTNFLEMTYAPGTHLTQYLLNQDIPPYSALDSLLTGMLLNPHKAQEYLRIIGPQYWSNANTQYFHIKQFLDDDSFKQFKVSCDAFANNPGDRFQRWDKKTQFMGLGGYGTTLEASGFAIQISNSQAYGYQNIETQSHYQLAEQMNKIEVCSTYHQAFARIKHLNLSIESLSSLASHQNTTERDIVIEIEPALVDKWAARSSYLSTEVQQDLAAWYQIQQGSPVDIELGIKTQTNYIYTPAHSESGADNLSLFYESQHYTYLLLNPGFVFQYNNDNLAMHVTASYQSQIIFQDNFKYGFGLAEQRYTSYANLSEGMCGIALNLSTKITPLKGLVLQQSFSRLPNAQYQLRLSATYIL